jgi:hypothetical protein
MAGAAVILIEFKLELNPSILPLAINKPPITSIPTFWLPPPITIPSLTWASPLISNVPPSAIITLPETKRAGKFFIAIITLFVPLMVRSPSTTRVPLMVTLPPRFTRLLGSLQ